MLPLELERVHVLTCFDLGRAWEEVSESMVNIAIPDIAPAS